MKIAIFPGSFDPFTIGHADIIERGLKVFDKIIVAIGVNTHKQSFQSEEERLQTISQLYADNPHVEVYTYSGLTTDFALQHGACAILRGIRSMKDYEYERDMADINQRLSGIETVLLFCRPEMTSISSSTLRELAHFNKDITDFLPHK